MMISVLARLKISRADRARRRTLWRELSACTTNEDLNDLEAAIARSDNAEIDPEIQEIHHFLAARRTLSQPRTLSQRA